MRTTSADYKTAIYATDRECRGYIKFNNDSTKIIRGVDGLISITLHEQLCDEERPMMNCACSRYAEVEFFNSGLPGGVSLANSYIDTYMGVVTKDTGTAPLGSIEPDTKTVEYIWNGRFFISEIDRGKLSTKVLAYDEFSKLNKQYVPTVTKGVSGYSANDILIDVLTQCNFTTAVGGISGYVQEIPECTCRQMMGWLIGAYSLGSNATMSRTNASNFGPRTLKTQWTHRDDADHLVTDNEIYLGGLADGDVFTVNSVTTGTADNPIVVGSGTGIVGENPYLTQANATTIYNDVNGITFKPMTIEFRGNPAIDTCDVLKVTSGGTSNYCYVQRLTTTFNGGIKQKIECFGDSEFYYSTELSPTTSQIKNAVSSMAQEIQQEIETADNGVITKVLDLDGSWKELVIANNQDLSAATSVWRWNINGLAHSTAYSGGTYNFAVDMNGRIIADVIQTGILQDAAGKNSWNLDTGALTITDGSINIVTNSETTDKIVLSHNQWTNGLSPLEWRLTNTSTNQELIGQAGGMYGYIYIGGVRTKTAHITSAGDLYLGANGSNGYIRLDGAANSMAYMRVTNGGEVGLADSSGTNIATIGGSNRSIELYDSSGVSVAHIGGSNRSIVLYDSSGNTAYNLDTSAKWLSIYDSLSTRTVLLNGASGGINLSNGTQYMAYTAGSTFGIYNGTSKYTALIWPDANGAGQFVLGDGTGTKWRTSLTNTGLTFRDSSDTITATYPSTGLQKLTGAVDSTSATGCVYAVPPQTFSSATTQQAAAEALLKYICTNYPNKTSCTFVGNYITTASRRGYELYISSTSTVNANGIPQYASGIVYEISSTMQVYSINCVNYVVTLSYSLPRIGAAETSDINNCTENGIYEYSSAAANTPTGTGGMLLSTKYSSTYGTQLLFPNLAVNNGARLYYRRKNANGWQPYYGVMTLKRQSGTDPYNESVIDYVANSGTTRTYTLVTAHTYLVTVARRNTTSTDKDGLWICAVHSTNSHLTAVKSPGVTYTISVSSTTLSITTWDNYMNISILDLGGY